MRSERWRSSLEPGPDPRTELVGQREALMEEADVLQVEQPDVLFEAGGTPRAGCVTLSVAKLLQREGLRSVAAEVTESRAVARSGIRRQFRHPEAEMASGAEPRRPVRVPGVG